MAKNKKYKIGVIVSGITDQYTENLCRGVFRRAMKKGVDAIIIPGKYLNRNLIDTPEIMYEYQYNTIFHTPSPKNLDGLIVAAGCIGCFTSEERVKELLDTYEGLPILQVSSNYGGFTSVNYDNSSGVIDSVNFLIDSQKCKKFAILTGPSGHTESVERKDAAVKAITEKGCEVLGIVEGFLSGDNHFASERILDYYSEADACICVNDDTALDLCKCMEKRGLKPGVDMKIVGYDNIVEGAKYKPAIATVNVDPVILGEKSVDMIIDMLNGCEVKSVDLPAQFIARASAGNVVDIDASGDRILNFEHLDQYFDSLFYRHNLYSRDKVFDLHKNFVNIMKDIIDCVDKNIPVKAVKNSFIQRFDEVLGDEALARVEMEDMLIYMERLHKLIKERKDSAAERYELRDMFAEVYMKLVSALDKRIGKSIGNQHKIMYNLKLFVRDSLNFSAGGDGSYGRLLRCMRRLGINNGAIYTMYKPTMHLYMEDFEMPEYHCLKATIVNGLVHNIPADNQLRPVDSLFDIADFFDDPKAFIVFPLFYNENLYGFLVCEFNEILYSHGEFVTNQLGAAMQMIELLKTNESINQQLEVNLITMKEHNIELDSLSKTDALTGIYNRRGFEEEAAKRYEAAKKEGKYVLVAYVDMNNLKIINDKYGHDSGDFSIKLISDILKAEVGDKGIIGRIGGDEFAFIKEMPNDEVDDFVKELKGKFDEYNISSDKAFNVTVSVGTKLVKSDEQCDLTCALSKADVSLYDDKLKKPTNVLKYVK